MNGKICLATGATAGLGKATAMALAGRGAGVILGCRDLARGRAAQSEIITRYPDAAPELIQLDLSSQASIRAAVSEFLGRHRHLDVLINNAAIFTRSRTVNSDGLETMFATNHLGPFLLTSLLLNALKASAPARVITVTAPSTVSLDFTDLQGERRFSALRAFGATKMANLLFTYELARRLEGTGVQGVGCHPGLVRTSLMREAPFPLRWLTWLASAPADRAATAVVELASAPELAGTTGLFFRHGKPIASNAYSHDPAVQSRLWEESLRLAHFVADIDPAS